MEKKQSYVILCYDTIAWSRVLFQNLVSKLPTPLKQVVFQDLKKTLLTQLKCTLPRVLLLLKKV